MNIAIIGSDRIDSMEANFKEAFDHRGDNARIFDIHTKWQYHNRITKKWALQLDILRRQYFDGYDRMFFDKLYEPIATFKPDLVIGFYRFLHPNLVHRIKNEIHCKIIQINPDQMTTFQQQQIFVSEYDVWFTKDPFILRFMRDKMKLNAKLYTEAFNARLHKIPEMPKEVAEKQLGIDVMTYGTMYPYRCKMLKHLIDAGIDIKLFGVIPNRFYDHTLDHAFTGRYITGAEKAQILYGSKIVFNQMHYAEVESVNERFVEANGCGAFQICDYKPILKDLLPIDPDLVSFKTIDEGLEKIKYYLLHPQDRHEIAAKVQKHFAENYTYDHLIQYILDNL